MGGQHVLTMILRPAVSSVSTRRVFLAEGMAHAETWRQKSARVRTSECPGGLEGGQARGMSENSGENRPLRALMHRETQALSPSSVLPAEWTPKGQHKADPVRLQLLPTPS